MIIKPPCSSKVMSSTELAHTAGTLRMVSYTCLTNCSPFLTSSRGAWNYPAEISRSGRIKLMGAILWLNEDESFAKGGSASFAEKLFMLTNLPFAALLSIPSVRS